jgi:hypothetical protein
MLQKRRNQRSLHAHSTLTCLCRRYAMAAMLDAHWYLLRLLLPIFKHNVTGLGHIKPFRLKKRNSHLMMPWSASVLRTTRLKKRRS